MFPFHLFSLVVVLYPTLIHADYTIDDSNYSTLKFSENPAGPVWGPYGSDTGEVLEIRLPNGTMQTIDATQCYDGTYTYAACSSANNCAVQFSFTGSGVTIYVLRAGPQGISASLSIDSGTATTATLDAPPPPQYYIPRVVLFDVQNIPSGTHTAVMAVSDWNGGFSGMMLDYIDVNQAQVASPTTSSSSALSPSSSVTQSSSPSMLSPTSTGSPAESQQTSSTGAQTDFATSVVTVLSVTPVHSSQSSGLTALPSGTSSGDSSGPPNSLSSTSRKTNVTAIAGGAAGGVIGLLALLALTFCYCRLRLRQRQKALKERPSPFLLPHPEVGYTTIDPDLADPFAAPSINQLPEIAYPYQTSTPNVVTRNLRSSSPIISFYHGRGASSSNISGTSSVRVSIGAAGAAATSRDQNSPTPTPTQLHSPVCPPGAVSYPSEKSRRFSGTAIRSPRQDPRASLNAAGARPNEVLTDEQADFVNSLFNNNVPAPVVARVLERMLASPQGASSVSVNDPEVRALVDPRNLAPSSQAQMQTQSLALGHVSRLPTVSDRGDGETAIGTAPPSYDHVQAQ